MTLTDFRHVYSVADCGALYVNGVLTPTGTADAPVEYGVAPAGRLIYRLEHVHVGGTCVKNRFGPRCPSPRVAAGAQGEEDGRVDSRFESGASSPTRRRPSLWQRIACWMGDHDWDCRRSHSCKGNHRCRACGHRPPQHRKG